MPKNYVLFIFLVCANFFTTIKCQTCDGSKLYYTSTLTCTKIIDIFPNFTKPILSMTCVDCTVRTINITTITNFKGETFNLSSSHVETISPDAFESFPKNKLRRLVFENNNITYIAPGVFKRFSELEEIILKKNNISRLDEGILDSTNVSILDLSNNHLFDIATMFAGLKVTILNISFNEITSLPLGAFSKTVFWPGMQWRVKPQTLDLSNNFIDKIQEGVFKWSNQNESLRRLMLENNRLTAIPNNTFLELNYLTSLTLEGNYIVELEENSLQGLSELTTLILSNNQIEELPLSLFAGLQRLESLDLSRNKLKTLTINTFSGLTSLTKLNISHNNLRVLDVSSIFPLGKLISLDISDTKLNEINLPLMLEHHHKLRTLILNDNFWTCRDLVEMYRQMNEKFGGFNLPSDRFQVSNLHGIACSRQILDSYDDITFNDFLNFIAQDKLYDDVVESPINKDYGATMDIDDMTSMFKSILSIFYLLEIITVLLIMTCLNFIIRCAYSYLYRRYTSAYDKNHFIHSSNSDAVELI